MKTEAEYSELKPVMDFPRLPLEGKIDLTYRCNNHCCHCWLRIPFNSKVQEQELSFTEIRRMVDEARAMGCRRWSISGGEPMLRPDFREIFDYITRNSISYSLNTNGTLITPKIAQLMQRRGSNMVALYGATAEGHDQITRNPGSFEAMLEGIAYLKEAKAVFIMQIIPMWDNYYQFKEMVRLAESLSPYHRIGSVWLFLSASGDKEKNLEIMRQRLSPKDVVELDKPNLSYAEGLKEEKENYCQQGENGSLFSSCISARGSFHIDPYGQTTFCQFIKEPSLRYDLRKGNLGDCWENFIPSLSGVVEESEEYRKHCGSCALRNDCRWCPVYGYLEQRNFCAKVDYLCAVAKENIRFKENLRKNNRRYYGIGGITIQLDSDLAFTDTEPDLKFKAFEVAGPGEDVISIRYHFFLPDFDLKNLGEEVYKSEPWTIYKREDGWVYFNSLPYAEDKNSKRIVVFNRNHTRVKVYLDKEEIPWGSQTHPFRLFPIDQLILSRILADRQGCYLHSCGVNLAGRGLIFSGHSGAGKSTLSGMLKGRAEILCDDRIILRKEAPGFKIYGTWNNGNNMPEVSANSACLKAIIFLEKSQENRLIPLDDKKEKVKRILSSVMRSLVTVDWWEKILSLVEGISEAVPCYVLYFDKSGKAADLITKL